MTNVGGKQSVIIKGCDPKGSASCGQFDDCKDRDPIDFTCGILTPQKRHVTTREKVDSNVHKANAILL